MPTDTTYPPTHPPYPPHTLPMEVPTMSTPTTHPCYAHTRRGTQCTNHGTEVHAYTHGGVARTVVPLSYTGGTWLWSRIYLCGTHQRTLTTKGSVSIHLHYMFPTHEAMVQAHLPSMERTPTTWNDPELQRAQDLGNQLFPHPPATGIPSTRKAILCGKCKKNKVAIPYHPTIEDVKSCYKNR